ncbi:MAG: hypothetical protein K6G61_00955 [Solobacterium sp.]|nr:hypothetical protein [Solobacterium sp.]
MANKKMTESLQTVLTELLRQADEQLIQSRIFAGMGYGRLADKYAECAEAERGLAVKCIDRLLALGCDVKLEAKQNGFVCSDPVKWLKHEVEVSEARLVWLKKVMEAACADYTTYEILKAYYLGEEKDMYWAKWQLDVIECIGLENWLIRQM